LEHSEETRAAQAQYTGTDSLEQPSNPKLGAFMSSPLSTQDAEQEQLLWRRQLQRLWPLTNGLGL